MQNSENSDLSFFYHFFPFCAIFTVFEKYFCKLSPVPYEETFREDCKHSWAVTALTELRCNDHER